MVKQWRLLLLAALSLVAGVSIKAVSKEDRRLEVEHVAYHQRIGTVIWGQRLQKFRIWNNTSKTVVFDGEVYGKDGRNGRGLPCFEACYFGRRMKQLKPGESLIVWRGIHDARSPWIAQMNYVEVNPVSKKLEEWSKSLPAGVEVWMNEHLNSETQREARSELIQPYRGLKTRGELAAK